MKITLLTCLASAALALSVLGQTPTAPPDAPAPPVATPAAAAAATAPALEKSADDADDLEGRITRKAKKHGLSITFGDDEKRDRGSAIGIVTGTVTVCTWAVVISTMER